MFWNNNKKRLEAAQQELLKLYTMGFGGLAIPPKFWFESATRMHNAGVIEMVTKGWDEDMVADKVVISHVPEKKEMH